MLYFGSLDEKAKFYNGWLVARYKPKFALGGSAGFSDAAGFMAALTFCPEYNPKQPVSYTDVLGINGEITWDKMKPILLDHLAEINPRDFGQFAISDESKHSVDEWVKYCKAKGYK